MGSRLEKGSQAARKRIETHTFEDEEGDEYEASKFGGFADYFRRKKIKLQNLDADVRSQSSGKPAIFRGVVAHVNGYTQPSLNDLHHLIVSHGGGFMQYLDGKTTVTHIIAANLTPKKAIEFRRYRIVKPAWVLDSVREGKLLPWNAYRVLDEGLGQRLLGFDEGRIVSQTNTQHRGYRDQTNTSWYTSQVKNVAEDIDDEDGTQFPSTQPVSLSEVGEYMAGSSKEQARVLDAKGKDIDEDNPTSSGSFEVTSSFEDALNSAATGEPPGPQALSEDQTTRALSPGPETQPSAAYTVESAEVEADPILSDVANDQLLPNHGKGPHERDSISSSKKAKVMSAEEHNAILLADPHIRKSSTANPEFLKQYYSESRLHHLSTWKSDLKAQFQQMAAARTASQRQPAKWKPGARRYVMHVDFDSFFCAVSLLSAPEYIDRPAVVAHGSGTGSEIASCNYPARVFGVKNGMWMKNALKLYPNVKVLPYDFPAYEEASKRFYEAIIDVGGIVQSVSIDEALVDITSLCLPAGGSDGVGIREGSIWREQEKADDIAQALRLSIKEKTGCAVSIGIGGNILLAKVALRKAKPAGQHQIKPEEVMDFIGELSVQDLPGVAYSIGGKLEEIGVKFAKDVRRLTKDRLMTVLGPKTGEKIWDYSRGIDRSEVGEQVVRKSVSAEVNWGIRFISQSEAEEFVHNLCIELQRRLVEQRVKGRQLTMKIMRKSADAPLDPPKHLGHGKCDIFNKSIVLGVATNSGEVIGREAVSVLRSYGFSPGELRGLGVQMTKLEQLKPSSDILADGCQRRINFGVSATPKLPKQLTEDSIDGPRTPKKPKAPPISRDWSHDKFGIRALEDPIDESITPQKPRTTATGLLDGDDPIDDKNSPLKAKATAVHPATAVSRANASDQGAKKLLNLTGTQFILPTQIDQNILAELPQDIRSKLLAQSRSRPTSRDQSPSIKSRSQSPSREGSVPLPSQLDPEVFEALPEDMKAEILASYSTTARPSRAQSILPESPRKTRPGPTMKKTTPTKKRGRPPGALNRKNRQDPYSTLTQSNFVPSKAEAFANPRDNGPESEGYSSDTLDPDFLSALPEDVRQEIVNEHRRKRLVKKGGLMTSTIGKKRRPPEAPQLRQRKLRLPPKILRPTFTTRELSTLPQLKDTLTSWHKEFAEDGPHPDDVAAMERYLRRVVLDEQDLGKVVSLVKWLGWLIEESDNDNEGTRAWTTALEGMKENVQLAVKERGLGLLEL